jgi:hypothetical protein
MLPCRLAFCSILILDVVKKVMCNIALIGTMILCLIKYSHGHINKIWTYSSDWNSDSVFRFLWCQHESTLVRKWSDVGAGVMQLQSRKDHIIFGQMQPTVWRMIFRTCCHKQAQLENRLKDVAVLEEQMHLMLWGWKAELQAVPASSLPVCPSLTFSSPAAHISEIVSARLHSYWIFHAVVAGRN